MSSPNKPPAPSWTVNGMQRTVDQASPTIGRYVYEVTFTTGTGATGVVPVAEADIGDAAKVRALIAAKAAQLDAINTSTSETG